MPSIRQPSPADRVDVVVEEVVARPVERGGLPQARHRHSDAGRDTGAQRARGALDAGSPAVLRMAGALGIELAELLQVLQRNGELAEHLVLGIDRLDSSQVQRRVEQGRCMAGGQHEAIAIAPDRMVGIEPQELLPHRVHHRRQRHRSTGMAGIGRLHGVHAQACGSCRWRACRWDRCSRAGKSVLAVWVMVNLPRCATCDRRSRSIVWSSADRHA